MNNFFFFGKNKKPIREGSEDRPFYSIISRGLMHYSNMNPAIWGAIAPQIDDDIVGKSSNIPVDIRNFCHKIELLTISDSMKAINIFLEKNGGVVLSTIYKKPIIDEFNFESCLIKEGHTSSVWKISVKSKKRNVPKDFILNIGRDRFASQELWETTETMTLIKKGWQDAPIAQVFCRDKIILPDINYEVVVTANEWIENAKELHLVNDIDQKKQFLFAIDEFVMGEYNEKIVQLKGDSLSEAENAAVFEQINIFLTQAAKLLPYPPKIEVNDGDVVWNGEKAVFVALS